MQWSLSNFNNLIWNEISRGLYGTERRKLDNVWFLYPKRRKAESLSSTQDKLGNSSFPISINWLIFWTGRRELDNLSFLYPKNGKTESLSSTQDKLGNTPFLISIHSFGMRYRAAYIDWNGGNCSMSDSYNQRIGKQKRYQLLKINLAMLPF